MNVAGDTTLVITRLFDASPARVFDAWLNREEWQSWIGPEGIDCVVSLLEPRVGGRYKLEMHMPTGESIPVAGVFRIIDPPRTLSFSWGPDGDPSRQSLVTLTFVEREGKTEMTLRQEGLGSAANRDLFRQGWDSALNKLARYVAQERS